MKTQLVFFFLILACGTSIIGWFFFRDRITPTHLSYTLEQTRETYSEKKLNIEKQSKQDALIYNRAISEKKGSFCAEIVDLQLQGDCLDTMIVIDALAKNDLNLCTTVKNPDIGTKCRDKLSLKIAEEKGDTTLCAVISETGSKIYCQETIDEKKLQTAQNENTVTEDFCQSLNGKYSEICSTSLLQQEAQKNYTVAIKDNNASGCDLINAPSEKQLCLDTLTLKRAMTEGDVQICESIGQAEKKLYCQKMLTKKNDTELFRKYIGENNLEGCKFITDATLGNKCHDAVTLSLVRINKDVSLCKNMTNTGMTSSCQKLAE